MLDRIRIVLVRPRESGNIGAVTRAMANHGLSDLVLVDPPTYDPEAVRWMAPGAHDLVARTRFVASVEDAVGDCGFCVGTTARTRRWDWPVLDPQGLATTCAERKDRVAVLFGPEDTGLSNDDLRVCHTAVRIPTAGHASLNVSQAVLAISIALLDRARAEGASPGEAPRQGRRGGPERDFGEQRVRQAEAAPLALQRLAIDDVVQVLDEAGFFRSRAREKVDGTLFRMLERAQPDKAEVGLVRTIARTLRHRTDPDQ